MNCYIYYMNKYPIQKICTCTQVWVVDMKCIFDLMNAFLTNFNICIDPRTLEANDKILEICSCQVQSLLKVTPKCV